MPSISLTLAHTQSKLSSKDYKFKSEGDREFTLNVCQGVKSELWNPTEVDKQKDIGGFVRAGHGDFSIGYVQVLALLDMRMGRKLM